MGTKRAFKTKWKAFLIVSKIICFEGQSPNWRVSILSFRVKKKAKHLCRNLTKKAKKQYFKCDYSKDMTSNKQFWDAVKPLFTNKNLYFDDDISINDKNKINNNEVKLFELLNTIFIDEVENTTGKRWVV